MTKYQKQTIKQKPQKLSEGIEEDQGSHDQREAKPISCCFSPWGICPFQSDYFVKVLQTHLHKKELLGHVSSHIIFSDIPDRSKF